MSTTIAGSPLPDKFSHIFFEVALQVLPEFNYDDLVYLSLLVRAQQREPLYFSLVDAIRKVQWMKLSSRDATIVDAALFAQYDGSADVALNDPVGQITHSKALLELVSHSQAAPDSLAVFLNDLLALGYNGGNRDFRRDTFKKKLHLHAPLWSPKALTAITTTAATRATHYSTPELIENWVGSVDERYRDFTPAMFNRLQAHARFSTSALATTPSWCVLYDERPV